MLIIGCDFHPKFQQIAFTDTETGEYEERRLHHPQEAEQFYRALAGGKARVGMEATGSFRWFRRLLSGDAQRLMTHPGVGPVVALAYVLVIGDWQRFPRGKYVASYLGLIPEEDSSSNKRRLGHITKQGNSLVRWLLVEAATKAQRCDPAWHRQYLRLARNKHHGVAKVAIARKLSIRLYWMLRSGQDYEQVKERSSHAGQSVEASGHSLRRPTF